MNALLFLLATGSIVCALLGRREAAVVLFAIGVCGTLAWFEHHRTSPLALVF